MNKKISRMLIPAAIIVGMSAPQVAQAQSLFTTPQEAAAVQAVEGQVNSAIEDIQAQLQPVIDENVKLAEQEAAKFLAENDYSATIYSTNITVDTPTESHNTTIPVKGTKLTHMLNNTQLPGVKVTAVEQEENFSAGVVETEPGTEYRDNPNLYTGEQKVISKGTPGTNIELKRDAINQKGDKKAAKYSHVVEKATPNIVEKGTKTKPAPVNPNPVAKTPYVAQVANPGVWDRLAECESGGNWSINTGLYDGGLQHHPATWNAYGGQQYAPTADQATREQQIAIATKVQQSQGWGAWPACSAKLGLR